MDCYRSVTFDCKFLSLLVVIGSGPAGQKGTICAARRRKKVAIISRKNWRRLCTHRNQIVLCTVSFATKHLAGVRIETAHPSSMLPRACAELIRVEWTLAID